MPATVNRKPALICWNCEHETDEPISVSLRAPLGGDSTLTLCRHCYTTEYVPLTVAAREPGAGPDDDGDVLGDPRQVGQ